MSENDELLKRAEAMCKYDNTNKISWWMDDLFSSQVDEIVSLITDLATALRRVEAERGEARKAVRTVQNAAKTLTACKDAQIADLARKDRSEYVATKTLDSERAANELLTTRAERAEARLAEYERALIAIRDGDPHDHLRGNAAKWPCIIAKNALAFPAPPATGGE